MQKVSFSLMARPLVTASKRDDELGKILRLQNRYIANEMALEIYW